MGTYERCFKHINNSRLDCMKRMRDVEADSVRANVIVLFELSCMMINEALDIKARSLV